MLRSVLNPSWSIAGERVEGEHVHPPPEDERGDRRPALEQPQHSGRTRSGRSRGRAQAGGRTRERRADARGVVVERQRAGERVEHLLGRMGVAALLEPDVVVDADAGEQRQLLAPQARHPAAAEVGSPTSSGVTSARRARRNSPSRLCVSPMPSWMLRRGASAKVALAVPRSATPGRPGLWLAGARDAGPWTP